mmetsp:Transcript_53784/g.126936  ORF Transcript_53784/g.126936 Transcript_53784/m.126936 type:complete len:559 (+) Transcript_53784:879-2555(+)
MLVERNQRAQRTRRQCVQHQRRARAVAREAAVAGQHLAVERGRRGRRLLGQGLGCGLALHQRLALCQAVGQQLAMLVGQPVGQLPAGPVVRPLHRDELDGDHIRALVQHLEVGMLAVGAGLAPDDGRRGQRQRMAVQVHALAVALHLQLLQIRWQSTQALVIRCNAAAGEAVEVAVPDVDQTQQHRQVLGERRGRKVLVHRMRAGQQVAEVAGADRDRDRQTDDRPQRVAATDPVPEAKGRVDAKGRSGRGVAAGGDEVARHVRTACGQEPGLGRLRIGQRFLGREGLGRDDEQRVLGIEACQHRRKVMAVDIGDEMQLQVTPPKSLQRLHDHRRPEVAAADADMDDVRDRAALATAHALGKGQHRVQRGLHLGVERRAAAGRCAQSRVQHRAALGVVDRVAAQQRITPRLQPAVGGQFQQQGQRRRVDAVLGQVGEDLGRLEGQRVKAARIALEGVADVEATAARGKVGLQLGPDRRQIAAGRHVRRPRSTGRACRRRPRTGGYPRPASRWPWRPRSAQNGRRPRRGGRPAWPAPWPGRARATAGQRWPAVAPAGRG